MTAKPPPLPASLQRVVDEAREAQSMEDSLRGPLRLQDQLLRIRAQRAFEAQKYRKAGSYTLAEKYKLLDIYPPTVVLTDTKPA